jgi:hypothetical protein
MKLTLVANFIKLFCCNQCHYRHIALSFDSNYSARDENYANKSFIKLTPVANLINFLT